MFFFGNNNDLEKQIDCVIENILETNMRVSIEKMYILNLKLNKLLPTPEKKSHVDASHTFFTAVYDRIRSFFS